MFLTWKIRYLDRNDREFKDRYLHLDTETLDPATRAAIELVAEAKTSKTERREGLKDRGDQVLDAHLAGFQPAFERALCSKA